MCRSLSIRQVLHALTLVSLQTTFLFGTAALCQESSSTAPSASSVDATKPSPPAKDDKTPPDATKPTPATVFAQAMDQYRKERFITAYAQFNLAGENAGANGAAGYAWATRAALHLKQLGEAETAAKKALEVNKNLSTAKSAMGEVYFRQGKFHEAEQVFREIVQAQIPDPRSYLGLARIYRSTANYKAAKSMIDEAHALDDKDPDIFWQWLRTLQSKERFEAIKARMAIAPIDDSEENSGIQSVVEVMEDSEKRPDRGCRLVTKVKSTESRLEPLLYDAKRLRGFGLLVKVNDTNAKLLIDTGASGILISSKVAERAGVERVATQDIRGIGDKGASHGYIALAHKIQIGELQFENCYVDVVDRKTPFDEEGLIGTDVFEDFLVDLDFPNRKFRLSPLPPFPDEVAKAAELHPDGGSGPNLHNRFIPPEYEKYDKVYRFGHHLLVPTRLNNSPVKLLILDTGAWDNTVSPAAAREATKIHEESDIKVKGLSGNVNKVYTAEEITLTFSNFQQKREDMVAFDMTNISNSIGTEVSGTLGFTMLWMLEVKIDYRDNLVNFTYDAKRFH